MVTATATPVRSTAALQSTVVAALGVVIAFVEAILFFVALKAHGSLGGIDKVIGVPSVAISVLFFGVVLTASVTRLAGAGYGRSWFASLSVVTAIGTIFQVIVVIVDFSWFSIILVALALALLALTVRSSRAAGGREAQIARADRTIALGIFLILAGLAGLTAAMNLTFDDVNLLTTGLKQSCDFSAFAQCSANLHSWEGSLFGFPNPLIGLGAFTVPLVFGVGILFGARVDRWFWVTFNVCVALALIFVGFLIYTSVFVIGTLCVWCALVWTFTIPTFWLTSFYNLKTGNVKVGAQATRFFSGAYTWVPIISLICYVIVFLLFQLHLNVLQYF